MKKKLVLALVLVVLVFTSLPVGAWAIGPNPPTLTVVVYGAPRDAQMHAVLQYEGLTLSCPMECEHRAWETLYRLYREGVSMHSRWHGNREDFRDAVLVLDSGEEQKRVPIPYGLLAASGYNEIVTLRYADGELSYGFAPWRKPLMIGIRVFSALLIEGIFFRLSGFTRKKSWLLFITINLLIHGFLNSLCYGRINLTGSRYAVGFFTAVLLSFLVELCAFVLTVDEYNSDRLSRCLIRANVTSHAFNYLLMAFLPL